jgi:hypothetical protein
LAIQDDSKYYFGGTNSKSTATSGRDSKRRPAGRVLAPVAKARAEAAAAAAAGGTPEAPGGGGTRYYSGGGGGGGGNPSKPYLNYYTRILNISPNKALVAKAVKGKYTMTEFQLLVQREDTTRFLKTWKGQETVSNFRTMWSRIFPSMGRDPGVKALRNFLKQEPAKGAKGYRQVTNPTSMREMYRYLSGTKLFKKTYPEFAGTKFERTLDFAGYRGEKDQFRNIIRAYTDKFATDDEIGYFFNSRITSSEFEKNLQTMITGGESFEYATGKPVEAETAKKAMYGRKGSAQTLAKVAAAYAQREAFQKSRESEYLTQMDKETARVTTTQAY